MHALFRVARGQVMILVATIVASASVSAASFDCSKAVSQTDRRICASPELQQLDQKMSTRYRQNAVGDDAAAWRTDQRAWLRSRDRCTDTACLKRVYSERLTVLEYGLGPFHWPGKWWRVDASGHAGATLDIVNWTGQGFHFHLEASAGANQGELDGAARFGPDGTARYASGNATERCELIFRRMVNRIEVEQNGDQFACGAGMGVSYDGDYVRSASDPNGKPDLVALGVVKTEAQNRAIRELLGSDYDALAATAGGVNDNSSASGISGVTVMETFVEGLACDMKSVVAYDGGGHIWVGLWSPNAKSGQQALASGVVELRYYTNSPGDKRHLPAFIESRRNQVCPSEREVLRVMP